MTEEKRKPGRPAGSKNKPKEQAPLTKEDAAMKKAAVKRAKVGSRVRDEIWAIIIIALGVFFVIALLTNTAGAVGTFFKSFFLGIFGWLGYVFPFYLILYGVLLFLDRAAHITWKTAIFMFLIFLMLTLLVSSFYIGPDKFDFSLKAFGHYYGLGAKSGGAFGMVIGSLIVNGIGKAGLILLAVVVTVVLILLVLDTPVSKFFEDWRVKRAERKLAKEAMLAGAVSSAKAAAADEKKETELPPRVPITEETVSAAAPVPTASYDDDYVPGSMSKGQVNIMNYMKDDSLFEESESPEDGVKYGLDENEPPAEGYGLVPDNAEKTAVTANAGPVKVTGKDIKAAALTQEELDAAPVVKEYKFPPLTLLAPAKHGKLSSDSSVRAKAEKLEETLSNFHVDAKVVAVTQGPAITRYELQPAVGVKVSSIVRLADDIALNLAAKSIRIEAPIPGKSVVGIEIENENKNSVCLREIIDSSEFRNAKSKLSFAVGRDIAGQAIVCNLAEMPHLLIGGSTGSGKSVCINSIILSLLYKAKPDEVKLVLVDPKVVELSGYNGIPHLLIPVVTEPAKAAAALNWAVAEMDDRYVKFSEESTRDLKSYNEAVKKKGEADKVMPEIVIIIDELADLMMAAPSQVEESICRIAQKARAAGMHLIVATQRPSVDVVTGVIKANIPSRISFAVSSQIDSRTILDQGGAEHLVGKGDMLYKPLGQGTVTRVQGTFTSDDDVNKVIEFVKSQSEPVEYAGEVISTIECAGAGASSGSGASRASDEDELLPEAIDLIVHAGSASVSLLQRRFRIGYNRAARLIDIMEEQGIVGPPDGSRPRQVLISEVDYYGMQNGILPENEEDEE